MNVKAFLLTIMITATCGVAQAASSPAQAGYCFEAQRYWVNQMSQGLTCTASLTQEQCDTITGPLRRTLDENRRLLSSWTVFAQSILLSNSAALELQRGKAQARSDLELVQARIKAHEDACKNAPDYSACLAEKGKDIDPTIEGIQARNKACQRGPEL